MQQWCDDFPEIGDKVLWRICAPALRALERSSVRGTGDDETPKWWSISLQLCSESETSETCIRYFSVLLFVVVVKWNIIVLAFCKGLSWAVKAIID